MLVYESLFKDSHNNFEEEINMLHNEYVEQVNRMMNKGLRGRIILDKDDSKKFEPESMEPRVIEMENVLPVEDWETTFEIDRLMNEGLGDSLMMDDDEH